MKAFTKANPHHHEYHYTNIPFQNTEYEAGALGSSANDVVQIIRQCISVLSKEGTPKGNPHHFTRRIALLLLRHLVGDLHQPFMWGTPINQDDQVAVPRSESQLDSREIESTRGGNIS